MRIRSLTVRAAVPLVLAAGLSGCKVVVTAQPPSAPEPASASAGQVASSPAQAPSQPGSRHRLARISDEGQVTYSLQLTRCHLRDGGQLPDPRCTPGSIDPAVTQANIATTICRAGGYTTKVRPPESQTTHAKYDVSYPAYHVPSSAHSELDHLVSLELGGSNDITNLWPEVGRIPNPKDAVENALHKAVCDGQVTLAAAQRAIATDWMTAQARLGLH